MPNIGFSELIIILLIVVVLFGATRLPQLGKGLGEGIRNFKNSVKSSREEEPDESDETRKKSA